MEENVGQASVVYHICSFFRRHQHHRRLDHWLPLRESGFWKEPLALGLERRIQERKRGKEEAEGDTQVKGTLLSLLSLNRTKERKEKLFLPDCVLAGFSFLHLLRSRRRPMSGFFLPRFIGRPYGIWGLVGGCISTTAHCKVTRSVHILSISMQSPRLIGTAYAGVHFLRT